MFERVLIANRGEIAVRIERTLDRLGIESVAVFSDADAAAPHVRAADRAIHIGPTPARDSYLSIERVLDAAVRSGADAVHPGYGFLSERPDFAAACADAGLVFVGPGPEAMALLGDKATARRVAEEAGVPTLPGWSGEDLSDEEIIDRVGGDDLPLLVKAVAGGGGKGMKRVDTAADFDDALSSAKRESKAAFGDDRVLIEKYVTRPRHIEVQIFGDSHGHVVHLYERDCSLQRRHQKVIEEAPAPGMDAATRKTVTDAAIRAAKAVDYVGAGTVEFIADASEGLRADRIWFMEMNTRLQVEHPVTETVTGLDLVEWQLRVAAGEALPLAQEHIGLNGWAMEARLYAEDPAKGFLPSIGPLEHFRMPEEIRVDTGVEEGGEVSQFYDPMIAKLIARGDTREEAAAALADACREVEVWPVRTNAAFLARCLDHPDFVAGDIDTGFIPARQEQLVSAPPSADAFVAALALAAEDAASALGLPADSDRLSPWQATPDGLYGFRLNAPISTHHRVEVDGETILGGARPLVEGEWRWLVELRDEVSGVGRFEEASIQYEQVLVGERRVLNFVRTDGGVVLFDDGAAIAVRESEIAGPAGGAAAESDGSIRSPMPGKIVAVQVSAGQTVEKGKPMVVLEAMKMEHALSAPFDGVVAELNAKVGDQVSDGALLVKVTPA
jgi:3-methylcrotonyl-CoA carboxylase alpha subunit